MLNRLVDADALVRHEGVDAGVGAMVVQDGDRQPAGVKLLQPRQAIARLHHKHAIEGAAAERFGKPRDLARLLRKGEKDDVVVARLRFLHRTAQHFDHPVVRA